MVGAARSYDLRSSRLTAQFCPELGGRMTRLVLDNRHELLVPLHAPVDDLMHWPKAGAYPLFPYHNRVENAVLVANGERHPLSAHPDAAPHSLHGPAHRRPWRLGALAEDRLSMQLDYQADREWPWHFGAIQEYALDDGGMQLTLSLTNRDDRDMPAGLGWHPYFSGLPEVAHDAQYWWPMAADFLPEGERLAIDGSEAARLMPSAYLQDWSHVRFPVGASSAVEIRASQPFNHLVLHRAHDYFCVEPVSHVANGFALAQRGSAETGVVLLKPGDTLRGVIDLRLLDATGMAEPGGEHG